MSDVNQGQHTPPVFFDGKLAKLRASCDACNESKVRCSQSRPKCARCQRQGVLCVYGLSRRTHKAAPRVGDAQRAVEPLGATIPSASMYPQLSPVTSQSAGTAEGEMEVVCAAGDDFINVSEEVDETPESIFSSFNVPGGFDRFFENPMGSQGDTLSTDIGFSSLVASTSSPATKTCDSLYLDGRGGPGSYDCSCTSQLTKHMLDLFSLLQRQKRASIDVQLSSLKYAVKQADASLGCPCTTGDDVKIVIVAACIGRILQGFDAALRALAEAKARSLRRVAEHETSASADLPRMCSWGVLELEEDDEGDLRQHIWLMQFRKLEALLSHFSATISQLSHSGDSRNAAHGMVGEYIDIWLGQKAQCIRDLCATQGPASLGTRKPSN
ncbi:unnamed protein product [Clonostachys rosea]|uniref:Zn(2)-C6 fungal-type domain-containing protein n=1 Tax=Bionectria ochroleuca TaxID=29856 RepID=A0ABY6V4A2_BIOOC|nr:unnamed protein product [Clonostachys rosea]